MSGDLRRILLVEDDPAQAEFVSLHLARVLPQHGIQHTLTRCELLAGALARLADHDVVLLDLALPDSVGLVGVEHILASEDPPPVVVLTGNEDMAMAVSAVQHGAQDYVLKQDIGAGALVKALLYAVERHRLKRSLQAQTATLERSEANFRGIAANADGLLILSENQTILWANHAAADLFGLPDVSDPSLIGQPFPIPVVPDDEIEVEHEGRLLELRVVETIWEDGFALLASARDVSRRAAAEEQLVRAQKMAVLGRLTGGVAHDFSNVLTGLMGHADLLLEAADGLPEVTSHATAIARDLAFAARLTNKLRSLGRQQVTAPEHIDVHAVVERAAPLLQDLVGEEASLRFDLGAPRAGVLMDPVELEQVLLNLVDNARRASSPGGTIRIVTARPAAGCFELRVEDEGEGMDEETLQRATEAFFTTRDAGVDAQGGTESMGLGLSTVQEAVARADGEFELESTAGAGTRARVRLPLASDERMASVRSGDYASGDPATETVLVVDDEGVIRDIVKKVLENRGYKVMTADSGPEALRRILGYAGPLDLLVTDVMMPEMNGRELADQLLALRPRLKVLFISGYEERIVAPTGVLEEGTSFLAKPFRMEDVLDAVRAVLDAPTDA